MGDGWIATGVLIKGLKASGPSGSEATKLSERKPRRCLTLCVVRVHAGAPGRLKQLTTGAD
jgi:hypothetical protein